MSSGRHPVLPLALRLAPVAALLLSGCNTLGPPSVRRAPFEYNEALVRSRNEQLLLNLVRLRYRDTPYFLEPSSLSTQYELSGVAAAGITVVEGGDGDASTSTGISIVERPTVTWKPLQGEEFVTELLTPVPLDTVMLLPQSGWSIERVFRLAVQRLGPVWNAPSASGPTPAYKPVYEDFDAVACALRRLQVKGELELVLESRAPDRTTNGAGGGDGGSPPPCCPTGDGGEPAPPELDYVLRFHPAARGPIRPLPEDFCTVEGDERALLRRLLGPAGTAAGENFEVRLQAAHEAEGDDLAVATRSLLGTLYYLSQNVEVPDEDVESLVTSTTVAGVDWASSLLDDLFRVRCAGAGCEHERLPERIFVKVRYRDRWYFIPDTDLGSKSTFGLLVQLFSLQAGAPEGVDPALTLNLGG